MKDIIKIPVYHYEGKRDEVIIDEQSMREAFERKLRFLKLETKEGRKKEINKIYKSNERYS